MKARDRKMGEYEILPKDDPATEIRALLEARWCPPRDEAIRCYLRMLEKRLEEKAA